MSKIFFQNSLQVNIYEEHSNHYEVDRGVPQGSVLGPLIFILYINDLPAYLKEECIVLYADDSSVALAADTSYELEQKFVAIIRSFKDWCENNQLILNAEKTACIDFSNKKMYKKMTKVIVDNTEYRFQANAKFLGIHLDDNLSWSVQIDYICDRLNSTFYALLQLKLKLDKPHLLNVYYALCYSILSYNVTLWGNSVDSSRVFILQKRVLRLIFDLAYRDSCKPIFIEQQILTFPCIYIYKCILQIKQNLSEYDQNGINHEYETRQRDTLRVPRHNTVKYEKGPQYTGIKLYNNLPDNIRNITEYTKFKQTLKKYLSDRCLYSVKEFMTTE